MEDTGAASRGRAARLPREGRWGGAGRAAGGGRRAGPAVALRRRCPVVPLLRLIGFGRNQRANRLSQTESKNQVAVKSDQSACPPPRQDRVCVVVPKDFKHGVKTLLWALLNVAKNGERLFIVHVHRDKRISPKGVEEKLGDYVSLCNASKVICDLKIIKHGHVAKALAELIDREGITKLVMPGAADKRYSEEMKSLEFNPEIKLMKSAPLPCKIWFTCNGQLICTR
ncbi:U-box domain-containing protein 36-like [Miscanthus floridulus]|uniref:U-box domain-containing protein 36-like n=1 Tax=Miscanthus floridulus TaxID=154761 RepID=UPI00345871A9